MEDLVLLVMPCYNVENYVLEALNSVLEQTYTNYKLICCDDASTDNTLEILKLNQDKFNYVLLVNETNLGTGETINKMLYEYLNDDYKFSTWISADNILLPNFIEEHVNKLNEGYAITYSNYKRYPGLDLVEIAINFNHIKSGAFILGASFMFKSKLFKKIGKFNKLPGEDVYFAAEAALANAKFGKISTPLMLYRYNNPNSVTNRGTKISCAQDAKKLIENLDIENGEDAYD